MMVVLIVALVIVVGVVVTVVVGRVGIDSMAGPNRTSSFELPDRPLRASDLDDLHFDQSLRGYNMAQVDAVLDKLYDELARRDTERPAPTRAPERPAAPTSDADVVPFRSRREERRADDE